MTALFGLLMFVAGFYITKALKKGAEKDEQRGESI